MPDPMAMPACSILVRGTWPGYLGGGRLSAEKWRTVTVAVAAVTIDDGWQIAGLAAPDIDREASPAAAGLDAAGPAAEAAARSPCPTLISGASIFSLLGAGMVRQECGAPRAAENRTRDKQKAKEMKLIAEAAACAPKLYLAPVKPLVVHTTRFYVSSFALLTLNSRLISIEKYTLVMAGMLGC